MTQFTVLYSPALSPPQAFHPNSFIARFRCVLIDSRHQLTAASFLVSGVLCWVKIMKFIAQLIWLVLIVLSNSIVKTYDSQAECI